MTTTEKVKHTSGPWTVRETEMLSALEHLAECNLNEDNCASFEVANRRIRNIVLPAIRRAKGE